MSLLSCTYVDNHFSTAWLRLCIKCSLLLRESTEASRQNKNQLADFRFCTQWSKVSELDASQRDAALLGCSLACFSLLPRCCCL
jgi:hypothetical protein